MKPGLHISNFTWPEGAPRLGAAHGGLRNVYDVAQFEVFPKEIVPAVEAL